MLFCSVNPGGCTLYRLTLILQQQSVATVVYSNNPISMAIITRCITEHSFIVLKLKYVVFGINQPPRRFFITICANIALYEYTIAFLVHQRQCRAVPVVLVSGYYHLLRFCGI